MEIADLDGDGNNDIVFGGEAAGLHVYLTTYSADSVIKVKHWSLMDGGDGSNLRNSFSDPENVKR